MNEIERFGEGGDIELRSDDGKSIITGYAATFDTPSHDLGGFREVVRPGAFDRSLREKTDVIARANHRSEGLLGRLSSGTLRLSVDARGLRYEIDVPDTTVGRDTVEYIKRGDIRESSFAFTVPKEGAKWEARSGDGLMLRSLVDVDLVDVAPVIDKAAYPATQVSARTLRHAMAATGLVSKRLLDMGTEAKLRALLATIEVAAANIDAAVDAIEVLFGVDDEVTEPVGKVADTPPPDAQGDQGLASDQLRARLKLARS